MIYQGPLHEFLGIPEGLSKMPCLDRDDRGAIVHAMENVPHRFCCVPVAGVKRKNYKNPTIA
jgi:hypothetical protein